MNPRLKKVLIAAGAVFLALVVLRIGLAFVWPTINDVSTGATPEYPDLQPQRFPKRMRGGFVTFRMHWRGGWAK